MSCKVMPSSKKLTGHAWSMQLYLLLLFLRVLLSWFPAFNWERQPWLTLRQARPACHARLQCSYALSQQACAVVR